MGCDIHAVFQKKTKDGCWEDVQSLWDQDRCYLLFAWLGDVRNMGGIKSLSSRRGIPGDFIVDCCNYHKTSVKPYPGMCIESDDPFIFIGDHSFSWLSGDEILNTKAPDGLEYFTDEIRRLVKEHGEIRMVFGFDS